MKYEILIDTREQTPWEFKPSKNCVGSRVATLKTADYTIAGYEHLVLLERKATPAEIARNLTNKAKRAAFERELKRLESVPHAYVICEFTVAQLLAFPSNSGIPWRQRRYMKIKGPYLLKLVIELELAYKVRFVFAGDKAKEYALSVFKRVIERETLAS